MAKNLIIAALAIALLICTYLLYRSGSLSFSEENYESNYLSPNFWEPVNDSTARADIGEYRNQWTLRKKAYGVLYGKGMVEKYIDVTFKELIENYPPPPPDYNWEIGFYYVRKLDSNKKRKLDFYVIPTLVGQKDGKVLDFADPANAKYYTRISAGRTTNPPECDNCNSYDAGHLWP